MVVAAALNRDGGMSIVDVILIICGIYCLFTAGKMKCEHQIPKWLFSEQELYHIRQPKEFCEVMSPKTIIFGVLCMLFGAWGLITEFLITNKLAEAIGIGIFLVGIAWYMAQLSKAKKTYG